jgi:hypothetical protein
MMIAAAMAAVIVVVLLLGILGLDRASEWTMVAAFALAPCVELVVPGFRFFTISDVLLLVSIGLALPRLMARRLWLPPAFVIGSMAFVTISVLAGLQSSDPGGSYYYSARVIVALILIPALLVWWSPRSRVLLTLVLAYVAGTGVSVLVGVLEAGGSRSSGLTLHPNVFGYTAVLTLSLVPFLARTLTKRHRAWVGVTVFGIAVLGIMTSGSRAALVVALVLLVLVPAAERSIIAALTVLGSGLVAILIFSQRITAGGEGQDALSRLLGAGNVEGSDRARVEGVERVWALALEHPLLGSGFTFSDFVAHNGYVQIAAAAGFLGLAAFALVCASMVTPLFAKDDVHRQLAYPAIVFLCAAPVSPNLTDRYIGILLGLSMVGVVAIHGTRRRMRLDGPAQDQAGSRSAEGYRHRSDGSEPAPRLNG